MRARARHRHEEKTLFLHGVRTLGFIRNAAFRACDEPERRRATLARVGGRETPRRKARHVHGLELKALAAMDRHQPDCIHMKGGGWDLAQIALFCEQHKLADAIEGALNRKAEPDRAMIA